MITIDEIKIKTIKDYEKVKTKIKEGYIDDKIILFLKNNIGTSIEKVVIEYPYYDRDYLSTFYIHYSKKFRHYPKECYRLHFISGNARNLAYWGYMVLCPISLEGNRIGSTYLSPQVVIKDVAYTASCNIKVHLIGNEYTVKTFPWMKQDTDISTCAHVALWTVLRFYGQKFTHYKDPSMGEIIEKVQEEWGRKTPSQGLTPIQISHVLSEFGFQPIIRSVFSNSPIPLIDEMFAYLESGIPIIAMIASKAHAFSVFGHGTIHTERLSDDMFRNRIKEPGTNFILHSKLINSVYMMDDNLHPFKQLEKLSFNPGKGECIIDQITHIIIPLYVRMQLEYPNVYSRFVHLMKLSEFSWTKKETVVRIYITSENALKEHALTSVKMNERLSDIIRTLNMSRFVWCIDISTIEEYERGLISGRILIDSTAGSADVEPWILLHDDSTIKYLDDGEMNQEMEEITPYEHFVHNLNKYEPNH